MTIQRIYNSLGLALIIAFYCVSAHAANHTNSLPSRQAGPISIPSLAPSLENVTPAVVNIATYTKVKNVSPLLQSPFFRRFFDLPDTFEEERQSTSAGSGVIVDAVNGYVLTNHHVIANADEIEVNLQDGRSFAAKLIGSDSKVDIAVLKIETDEIVAAPIASSNDLLVGDFVLAIGNPFGIGQTVTSGIISALGRNGLGIQGYEDFIQTDASINPGNSGGALINIQGQLIGINSAIIAPSGGNVGIGFAIPIDVANLVMNQLIEFGVVKRGGIGATFQDLTPELAQAFDLKTFQGAVIAQVKPNGSADQAKLQAGDVIISANGRPVRNAADMHNRIGLSPIGQVLNLSILRGGKTIASKVEIAAIPVPEISGDKLSPYFSGSLVKDYIPQDEEKSIAVVIEALEADSNAAQMGLEKGDLLYGMNRQRVRNIDDLALMLDEQTPFSLRIRRGYEDLVLYLGR